MVVRQILLAACCGITCLAQWTPAQKEWALGTSAVLTKVNDERYDLLAGADDPQKIAYISDLLVNTWGIHSRDELTRQIVDLAWDNKSTEAIAWNYPRAVMLARWGHAVGYLNADEAWTVIMPAAQAIQRAFPSWQEMGRAYIRAREAFWGEGVALHRRNEYVYRTILMDPASPWRKYPWNFDLGNEHIRSIPAKSAELILAVHSQGLMCVRLRIPDHLDSRSLAYEPYLQAIEKTVGCKPRVKSTAYNSKDWTLDTECVNEETLHGTQVVARLRIEAIRQQLLSEGATELFLYVQHDPIGRSKLVPEAQDEYVADEQQWHTSTLALDTPLPDFILTYGPGTGKSVPEIRVRIESNISDSDKIAYVRNRR